MPFPKLEVRAWGEVRSWLVILSVKQIGVVFILCPHKIYCGRKLLKSSLVDKFCSIFVCSYWLFLGNCDFMHLSAHIALKIFVMHLCLTSYVVSSFQLFWSRKSEKDWVAWVSRTVFIPINNVFFDQNDWWSQFYAMDVTVKSKTLKTHLDW